MTLVQTRPSDHFSDDIRKFWSILFHAVIHSSVSLWPSTSISNFNCSLELSPSMLETHNKPGWWCLWCQMSGNVDKERASLNAPIFQETLVFMSTMKWKNVCIGLDNKGTEILHLVWMVHMQLGSFCGTLRSSPNPYQAFKVSFHTVNENLFQRNYLTYTCSTVVPVHVIFYAVAKLLVLGIHVHTNW